MRRQSTMLFMTAVLLMAIAIVPSICQATLRIIPVKTELSGKPGDTLTGTIAVTNQKDTPIVLETIFKYLNKDVAEDWISIDLDQHDIAPHETADIVYTIHIPEDARGNLLGRVGFSEAVDERAGIMSVRTRISVPLYVIIEGTENYQADITQFFITSTDSINITFSLKNNGNTYHRFKGVCSIVNNVSDETVCRFPVNTKEFPVYPGVEETFKEEQAVTLNPGDYTATLQISFPDKDNMVTKSVNFTVSDPAAVSTLTKDNG